MPLITIKTLAGNSKETLHKTMKEVNQLVAQNLGYDPAHVWVFVEEVDHDHFMTAGRTWEELKTIVHQ